MVKATCLISLQLTSRPQNGVHGFKLHYVRNFYCQSFPHSLTYSITPGSYQDPHLMLSYYILLYVSHVYNGEFEINVNLNYFLAYV